MIDESSCTPAFPVGVLHRPTEAGFANPVSVSRISSRTAESASLSKIFPFHWRGPLARGSSARRPMPHTGSRALASANRAQNVMFHGGVLREFGVIARYDGILFLSQAANSKLRSPRPMRLCVLGSGDDMMSSTVRWSLTSLAFSAIINCAAQEYDTPSTTNDEGDHCEK